MCFDEEAVMGTTVYLLGFWQPEVSGMYKGLEHVILAA
jgi:hypothetical protein